MCSKPIPRKLYKYRRFDVFCLRLLTHAKVMYSDPRLFNDPLDCDPTIEVDLDMMDLERLCYRMMRRTQPQNPARSEIGNYRYLSSGYGDFKTQPHAEDTLKCMLAQRIKDELTKEFGTFGVFLLSNRWGSVLMWGHYADHHRGVCIEFDTADVGTAQFRPVNYRGARRIRASDLLKWKRDGSAEAKRQVFDTFFLAKADPWRYEKEWRDIRTESGVKEASLRVTAVYFGIQCDASVVQSIVKFLDVIRTLRFTAWHRLTIVSGSGAIISTATRLGRVN